MPNKNTDLITRSQVAELLGVKPGNVTILVKRKVIPGPVRGLCPMPSLRRPRIEDAPAWDREAVLAAWRERAA